MPDTPVAEPPRSAYDLLMEARVSRLEEDMREEKAAWARLEAAVLRVETILAATLPHLATREDLAKLELKLAEKPGKLYMWGILTALLTAYACGLAALAVLR